MRHDLLSSERPNQPNKAHETPCPPQHQSPYASVLESRAEQQRRKISIHDQFSTVAFSVKNGNELTLPRTRKNLEPNSRPSWHVLVANTPRGKVNPHHPILNGNLRVYTIEVSAKKSQLSPNPQSINAIRNPRAEKMSPALAGRV